MDQRRGFGVEKNSGKNHIEKESNFMIIKKYMSAAIRIVITSSLTILLMYSSTVLSAQCAPKVYASDGCTDGGIIQAKHRALFYPYCVVHDRCYGTVGETRAACDAALIGAINKECDNSFGNRFLGHGDPDFIQCDFDANLMRTFFATDVLGLPSQAFAYEQEQTLAYAVPNATDNCDIDLGSGAAQLSTRESGVYGGPETEMVNGLSGYSALTGVSKSPTTEQANTIVSNYSVNGNSKPERVTCETTIQVVGTRTWCERDSPWTCRTRSEPIYGPVELCKDYNWQNEFIRDIQMGLDVWNGEYSGLIPAIIVPPANYTIALASILLDVPADKIGIAVILQTNVSNPDNATLEYAVDNLPLWAEFDATNGTISTKPNQPTSQDIVGNPYADVVVRVKDVANTEWRSIGPFVFTVAPNTNLQPTAIITAHRAVKLGNPFNISADLSTDANGDALTYQWAFTESNGNVIEFPANASNALVSPVFTVGGLVTAVLTVDDGTGSINSTGTTQKNIIVFSGRRI